MMWHGKKNVQPEGTTPAATHAPQNDKADRITAALAKIQDPPAAAVLPGAVVKAGMTTMPSQRPAMPPPQPEPAEDVARPLAASPGEPTASETKTETPSSHAKFPQLSSFNASELKKLRRSTTPEKDVAQVYAPTNPEADATIALHAAEQKKQAAAVAAAAAKNASRVPHDELFSPQMVSQKKRFILLAAGWLAAVPVAFGVYTIVRTVTHDQLRGFAGLLAMTPVYLLGLYGLVGWIPLVLLYIKTQRES